MAQFKPNAETISFESKMQNLKVVSVNDIAEDMYKFPGKGHYSFYILPNGDIIDCRKPVVLSHIGMCEFIYENIEQLSSMPEFNFLKLNDSILFKPGNEQYYKCAGAVKYAIVSDIVKRKPALRSRASGVGTYISDDSLLLHDLGWVKVVAEGVGAHMHFAIQTPTESVNGRTVTRLQGDSAKEIAELFGCEPKYEWQKAIAEAQKLGEDIDKLADFTM